MATTSITALCLVPCLRHWSAPLSAARRLPPSAVPTFPQCSPPIMPRVLNRPPSGIQEAVNRRFFVAVDVLVATGALRSLSGFAIECGLHAPRYREMRLQYGTHPTEGHVSRYVAIETEALYCLVAKYHVSARWLLTGQGRMINSKEK